MVPLTFTCLITALLIQVDAASTYDDLRTIFKIPAKRNYDQLEILERSNFDSDDSGPSTSTVEKPKSYANAQVMLRFGGGDKGKCACGDSCQCKCTPPYPPHPYYYPMMPHCFCFPHYPIPPYHPYAPPPPCMAAANKEAGEVEPEKTSEKTQAPQLTASVVVENNSKVNQVNIVQNDNVVNEAPQIVNNDVIDEEVKVVNHPQILTTVKLPEEIAPPTIPPPPPKILPLLPPPQCLDDEIDPPRTAIIEKIKPSSLTPNVKLIDIDLSKAPKLPENDICDLEASLLPYLGSQQERPKLLVTYPIFKNFAPKLGEGSQILLPQIQEERRGYHYSSGCGCYSDPIRTVIYKKPTVLTFVGPARPTIPIRRVKYICVPVNSVPAHNHGASCSCCSCARYSGELNEAGY